MTTNVIPSSPNWYCSRVSDANQTGDYAYGSRGSVLLWSLDNTRSPRFQYVGYIFAHLDKCTAVSLSRFSGHFASGGEDGKIKTWNIQTKTLIQEHHTHKNKVTSVHWSPVDRDLIVSADDAGLLNSWNIKTNSCITYQPEKSHVFCLTCSPHEHNIVAVGYKFGLILVLDVKESKVVHRLRGHDEEVHCVSWCPVRGENITKEDSVGEEGCILASGSRDKTIRLWSTLKGKCMNVYKVPNNVNKKERYQDHKTRIWLTLHWTQHSGNPTSLISSTNSGELLLWNLKDSAKPNVWQVFNGCSHNRIVFNITATGPDFQTLCTISMDRQVILWNLDTLESREILATNGGYVYSITASSLDPSRLAIGVGDNMIKIWKTSDTRNSCNVNTLWQGLKAKVTTLSWHPKKEGVLAYGTEDGRIGIYDVLSSRPPRISNTYHKKTVYVVTWGPSCTTTKDKDALFVVYSIGDGIILQHTLSNLKEDAVSVNDVIIKNNKTIESISHIRSEISWKPDCEVVAIGNDDGTVELFMAPKLYHICTIQVHNKLINCVRWHPAYVASESSPSQYSTWLAIGSNEIVIQIVDVKSAIDAAESLDSAVLITSGVCSLAGHHGRITSLCWSSHVEGHLVSASYDNTAQVWDVIKKQPLANFQGHQGRLLCVMWSLDDPDIIYSGADDYCVYKWKISEQQHTKPPDKGKKQRNKGRRRPVDQDDGFHGVNKVSNIEAVGDNDDLTTLIEKKRLELVDKEKETTADKSLVLAGSQSQQESESPQDVSSQSSPKKADIKAKIRRKVKSLFPVSGTLENRGKAQLQQDCIQISQMLYNDSPNSNVTESDSTHLGLFINRKTTYDVLKTEGEHHKRNDNFDYYCHLELLKGDIDQVLDEAIKTNSLNDWIVSMAPLASYKTWLDVCIKYAQQLTVAGLYSKAVSYYLAAHQVYPALDLLVEHNQFKEAIALARARLVSSDPKLKHIYHVWGTQLASDGNFEPAAKCFLAINQPREAAKNLAKRTGDLTALHCATDVAMLGKEEDMGRLYAQRCVLEDMTHFDWQLSLGLTTKYEPLKVFSLLTVVHMKMVQAFKKMCLCDCYVSDIKEMDMFSDLKLLQTEIMLDKDCKDELIPWEPYNEGGQSFVHCVLQIWLNGLNVDVSHPRMEMLLSELISLKQTRQHNESNLQQILIDCAIDVSIAMLCLLLRKTYQAVNHIIAAMCYCQDSQQFEVLEGLCRILLPTGPSYVEKLQHEVIAIKVVTSVSASKTLVRLLSTDDSQDTIEEFSLNANANGQYYTNTTKCSAWDTLAAFCYTSALRYMMKEKSGKNDDEETSHMTKMTLRVIEKYSSMLLWNAHAVKLALEDALTAIGSSVNTMIINHTVPSSTPSNTAIDKLGEGTNTTEQDTEEDVYNQTGPIISESGYGDGDVDHNAEEYYNPYPPSPYKSSKLAKSIHQDQEVAESKTTKVQVEAPMNLLPLKKCPQAQAHARVSRALSDMNEYVEMGTPADNVVVTNTDMQIIHETDKDNGAEANIAHLNQTARNATDLLENNALSITSATTMWADTFSFEKIFGKEAAEYDSVREDWYSLPVDNRYSHECVTLQLLTDEKQRLTELVHIIPTAIQKCPFPNCMESARLLLAVSQRYFSEDEYSAFKVKVIDWVKTFAVSTKDRIIK